MDIIGVGGITYCNTLYYQPLRAKPVICCHAARKVHSLVAYANVLYAIAITTNNQKEQL